MHSSIVNGLKINQVIAGLIISFGGFGFGCGLVWTAAALPSLQETDGIAHLTPKETSWIGSLFAIGALIGCPIAGFLMNVLGRKRSLWCFSTIGFAGWIFLAFAISPPDFYLGRFLTGASTGGYTIIIPVYISEIASKENRGLISSFFLILLCLGKLFSNLVGIFFNAHFASALCAVHPVLFSLLLFLIPDSPTFLVRQEKEKDALRALTWLYSKGLTSSFVTFKDTVQIGTKESQEIASKLETIKQGSFISNAQTQKIITWKELTSLEIIHPVSLVLIQMLLAQFCGINVSTFYTVEIFQMTGQMLVDPKMATIILAVIQTVGCLPCSIFVDKYGRKGLLTSSYFAMALGMGGFTAYFFLRDSAAYSRILNDYEIISLLPLGSLIIYNLAYAWGVGSIVWIVMSEILPPKIIGVASAIANTTFWGAAFTVTQLFQMFKEDIPLHYWFSFFTLACICGWLFNMFFLPETKGQSLQEIQLHFKRKTKDVISISV